MCGGCCAVVGVGGDLLARRISLAHPFHICESVHVRMQSCIACCVVGAVQGSVWSFTSTRVQLYAHTPRWCGVSQSSPPLKQRIAEWPAEGV